MGGVTGKSGNWLHTITGWSCTHSKHVSLQFRHYPRSRYTIWCSVGSSCQGSIFQLKRVHQLQKDLATVTHILVTSKFQYCHALCMGLPLKMTKKLQLDQNATAPVLLNKSRFHHATPLLQELHWLPAVFWVQVKLLVITYNAPYGLGASYLKDLTNFCRCIIIIRWGFSLDSTTEGSEVGGN